MYKATIAKWTMKSSDCLLVISSVIDILPCIVEFYHGNNNPLSFGLSDICLV